MSDSEQLHAWLNRMPDTESVARFCGNEDIRRLDLKFDICALKNALEDAMRTMGFCDLGSGFGVIPINRRPGVEGADPTDLSGRYYLRPDESLTEVAREDIVDEAAFCEFEPKLRGTYFEEVYNTLQQRFKIGRVRVLSKQVYNCNSWHRDPEPRLHIPIISNPGSLFIVNHHCTHLPADGSVYFTDTRGYHTALNGGESPRVHLVAALPINTHDAM
ncbi:MAG: hypothetical protein DHS20C01_27590 [marine bacterium B5-7]|nr:MAG: hypothetical protein DHS20C01_27590 [marine bacterium B5-7]